MTYLDLIEACPVITPSRLAPCRELANPDHHLWNNRGTWWCHFTLHHVNWTSERVRVSLRTRDLATARNRRDTLLNQFAK